MQFARIIGQRKLINSLVDMAMSGRVSHAQLFSGSYGSGSFALALAYAQFIACENKQFYDGTDKSGLKADSCGKCPSCIKYSRLIHPDLHLVFPNTTTKKIDSKNESLVFREQFTQYVLERNAYIDLPSWYEALGVDNKQGLINVRDAAYIVKALSMKTYESKYKIMIIWACDKLYHEAAPKLLKILEEPYENTLFLLVSDNIGNILGTIRSRTQLVKVLPIAEEDLAGHLQEEFAMEKDEALMISRQAGGDYIKALEYKDRSKAEFVACFMQWTRLAFQYRRKAGEISAFVERICKWGREEQKSFLSYSLELFRQCMHTTLGLETGMYFLDEEGEEFRRNFSRFVNETNIGEIYRLFERSQYNIQRNASSKMVLFDLTLQMGRLLSGK